MEQKNQIFISYAHASNENGVDLQKDVLDICNILTEVYKFNIWIDIKSLNIGEKWPKQIANGILSSELVLCFLSKAYLSSHNCRNELEFAKTKNKKIFLIALEKINLADHEDIEFQFCNMQISQVFKERDSSTGIWGSSMGIKLIENIRNVMTTNSNFKTLNVDSNNHNSCISEAHNTHRIQEKSNNLNDIFIACGIVTSLSTATSLLILIIYIKYFKKL